MKKYKKYAESVVSGNTVACRYIKLACSRYLSWFDRDDIEFRTDKADYVVNFLQHLEHFQGKFAGRKLILEEWQKFFIYGIYGWYYKGTDDRVVKHVILDCGRKQGKSMIGAGMALYHLIGEKESGAECDIVANSRQQAKILFDMCDAISKRMDKKGKHLKQTINRVKFPKTDSFIQVLASDSATLDGYGSSFYVEDEMHAAKDTKLYDVLASSQGARHNPLSMICTTAGYNLSGPYYTDIRKGAIDVLEGVIENDSLFALIFTLDEKDDYRDPNVWIKAMPNLGVTVSESYIKDRIQNIASQPSTEVDVLTKNFNCWVQSAQTWLKDERIMKTFESIDLKELEGELCFGGIDLASTTDMSVFSVMFPPNQSRDYYPDKYIFKSWVYLPEKSLSSSANSEFYKKAHKAGFLTLTPGNVCDYDYILNDLSVVNFFCMLEKVSYDTYNSTQFVISATEAGINMEPYGQGLGNFNRPTKEFERLILSDKVIIDASVMTRWCFQNVLLKEDTLHENVKPIKASKNQKIDIVIAMLESLGAYLSSPSYCYYVGNSSDK